MRERPAPTGLPSSAMDCPSLPSRPWDSHPHILQWPLLRNHPVLLNWGLSSFPCQGPLKKSIYKHILNCYVVYLKLICYMSITLNKKSLKIIKILVNNRRSEEGIWKLKAGTSLVTQGLGICLPVQGTWVRALVREDPTCCRETKSVHHNYWACALEPALHNYWSPRA